MVPVSIRRTTFAVSSEQPLRMSPARAPVSPTVTGIDSASFFLVYCFSRRAEIAPVPAADADVVFARFDA